MMNFPKQDVFLVKFNNSGILKWNRTWNTGFHNISEEALSFVIDSQDQIFLGVKTNFTGAEWVLLKYDSDGNLLSNISYTKQTPLEQLSLDSNDNLYAVGSLKDMFLTKFDNNGNLEWNLTCIQEILLGTESIAIDHNDNPSFYLPSMASIDAVYKFKHPLRPNCEYSLTLQYKSDNIEIGRKKIKILYKPDPVHDAYSISIDL